ncbi:MAG: efflux RND transporter permease subunit, partial [Microcystaceae cyanobacterium]
PGATGALYQQFALTIAFSIAISTFLALTLTPSLCALMLRPGQHPPAWIAWFFNSFNTGLDFVRDRYRRILLKLVQVKYIIIGVFIGLLVLTGWLYSFVPTAFLPEEDQGFFITIIQAPQGVSLQYTSKVMEKVEEKILKMPEVLGTFAVGGFSFGGSSSNQGIIFTTLKPWKLREASNQSVQAVIGQLFPQLAQIPEASIFPINPPPIRGLGNFGGFNYQLQDRRSQNDLDSLVQAMGQLLGAANQNPNLQRVFSTFQANTPQLLIEVNRNKAKALGVSVNDIFKTLETAMGSSYVNDFAFQERTYRVYLQADQKFRDHPEDINQLYVRSDSNQMIPLNNLVTITPTVSAQTINHYNLFRGISINGSAAMGVSSGQAMATMAQLSQTVLPQGFSYEWSGTSLEEIQSGGL